MDNNSYGYGYGSSGSGNNNGTGGKKDGKAVISDLERLKYKFDTAAHDYQEMSKTVQAALDLVRESEAKKDQLAFDQKTAATQQQSALVGVILAGARKKNDLVFLIDGSGSMTGAPLKAALDAVTTVTQGAKLAKASPVATAMFGDQQPHWIKGDLQDFGVRSKYESGLNTGTDLAPTAAEIIKTAAVNTLDGKSTHFILISDGDLFDMKNARESLERMLLQNRKATLDIVIIGRKGTSMELLATELAALFPKQVRHNIVSAQATGWSQRVEAVALSAEVQDAVTNIIADRLKPAAPKKTPAPKP